MGKLLPRVFEEDIDPDFSFAEALKENVEDIESGMPDWMEPFAQEGFSLGPVATACLIDWEWRSAQRRKMAAFQFVNQLCELETSTKGLGLDPKAIAGFIRGLTLEAKKEILRGIQEKRDQNPWKKALASVRSGWFQIYKELCRGQDRPAYLENCRSRIGQDWTLALPVVKDLERRKEYAEVADLCAIAVRSFLYMREGEKWDPREDLLIERAGYRINEEPDARLLDLLQGWEHSASALEKEEISAAIRLQSDLLRGWRNWDKALAAFRRLPQPHCASLQERLFSQWRHMVAQKSVGNFSYESYHDTPKSHWVHVLADAAWQGEDSRDSFCVSLREWIKEVEGDTETLRRSQNALARLCLDLDRASWLSSSSPTLVRLLSYGWSDDRALLASRRTWLERLGASSLTPELIAFWKRNTRRLVPDPGHSEGADYKRCADWARALWEMDPSACKDLIGQWSAVHARRRNLWRELRAKDLPGLPK